MTELAATATEAEAGTSIEAWEAPPRAAPTSAAPVLAVDGFEGPLDWLLEMARAQQLDLAKLSILQLVDAFLAALDAALAGQQGRSADLARWGDWLVMATTLALLRSRLLLPPDAPAAQAAQDEAAALQRLLLDRTFMRGRGRLAGPADPARPRRVRARRRRGGRVGPAPATAPSCCGPAWSCCACRNWQKRTSCIGRRSGG